jgi:hypothetical protein
MPTAGSEEAGLPEIAIVEVGDERTTLAGEALDLIRSEFPPGERQPLEQIAMEIAEKRLDLLTALDFHLFAAVDPAGHAVAVSSGIYLAGANVGLVTYLAVDAGYRQGKLGRRLRITLIEAFRQDARSIERRDLAAVVGEVRAESPWLRRLVRDRAAIPLDFDYYHPGEDPTSPGARWVLYRQPEADRRSEFPMKEVRQLLYAVYRRAYRVRWPLGHPGFQAMLEQLEGRATVGERELPPEEAG